MAFKAYIEVVSQLPSDALFGIKEWMSRYSPAHGSTAGACRAPTLGSESELGTADTEVTIYLAALKHLGARPSMTRKGDCWDNAVSESFFATLEKELLALQPLQSRSQTRKQVADYIENYYNLVRLHSRLDYVSPVEFETNVPN